MRIFVLLLSFFLTQQTALFGQEFLELPVRIDSVVIQGNEKTRDEVILREIPYQFPDTLNEEDFQIIQNRLQNLFLFNRVQLFLGQKQRKNLLIIQVTEMWYLFPAPLLFINEKDWSKWSYGLQIIHTNFRGRNEKLVVGGWLGYNPAFTFKYYNPWIGRRSRFILGITFLNSKIANKIFDFNEHHVGGKLTLGKRFNLHSSLMAFFSLRRIRLPHQFQQYTISGSQGDLVPKVGLQFESDHRDLYEYPRRGYYLKWEMTRAGFTNRQPRFWRWELDNRGYLKLHPRFSVGMRNLLTINRGYLPIYDRIFIGYSERIRGHFNRVFTGQNLVLHSLELRTTLIPVHYFSWKEAPLFPSLYQNLKFGLHLGIFVDSGIVWDVARQFATNRFHTGMGVGLHFQLPYVNVLRVERAWREHSHGEWIVDVGVAF